ncbi:hypothetical protein CC2G_011155 [Coprinopsis cinerea AmutBmut pab1-1]|nr:hypothetical protein CC2G_011155 [Coprinopsis cinerea AmutBmut pab1-1]
MSCPILDLPPELLSKLALHTSRTTETHPSTVKSCMLTCKTFAHHFRPRLFRRAAIELERSGPIERLLAILSANPGYGKYVKNLVIATSSLSTVHCPALPDLLLHLTEVSDLAMDSISFLSLPEPLAQSISSLCTRSPLSTLRIFACKDFPLDSALNPRAQMITIYEPSFCHSENEGEPVDAGTRQGSNLRVLRVTVPSKDVFPCPRRLLTFAANSLEVMQVNALEMRPFSLDLEGLVCLRHLLFSLSGVWRIDDALHLVTSLARSLPSVEQSLETISISFNILDPSVFMHLVDAAAEWGDLGGALQDRARLPRLREVQVEFGVRNLFAAGPLPEEDTCKRKAEEMARLAFKDVEAKIRVSVEIGNL